jgi:hypothetical protein
MYLFLGPRLKERPFLLVVHRGFREHSAQTGALARYVTTLPRLRMFSVPLRALKVSLAGQV